MSLQYNDTSTFKGIVQIAEKEMGVDRGYISGNTNRLIEFTADVNLAWDTYIDIADENSGTWGFDDSNFTDFPIIKTNLVASQNDYTFTTDENGNLIEEIDRVAILTSATDTEYTEIYPKDVQSERFDSDLLTETTSTGTPDWYDKTGNGLLLEPTPGYSATNGLKIYISREPSYFVSGDTTKKPGCPGRHHRYFALKPAFDYARRNDLTNYNRIREEVVSFEGDEKKGVVGSIARYFAKRSRDEEFRITNKQEHYR